MPLLHSLYPLLRPLFFKLEPETAHDLALAWLRRSHGCRLTRPLMSAAPGTGRGISLMGLHLRNPVGLAAGLDKNAACIDALGALGFGFLEVGTVTPLAQAGNPQPRLFRLPQRQALINRMGFNNDGLAVFVRNVRQSRWREQGGILGLNIGKNAATPMAQAVDDYLAGLTAVYPHADYITVNISSPNTQGLRAMQEGEEFENLLRALSQCRAGLADRHGRRVPLLVKIAPDLDAAQVDAIAHALPRYGIDGVIATNTTLAREAVAGLRHADEAGGLSGPPVHERSLAVISRLRQRLGPDFAIIGVGGILSARQALEKREAGANAVQLYTGLIYRGPALVSECVDAWPAS